jgi:SAM-dependent methyltransferase
MQSETTGHLLPYERLRGLKAGSPEWFLEQRRIIFSKPLIDRCYRSWYQRFSRDLQTVPMGYHDLTVLELGSGGGFLKEVLPEVVTSDVTPGVADLTVSGEGIPFGDGQLKGILMSHVLHHIHNVRSFFKESSRALCRGGVVSMIEVSHTPFARFFFSRFHPEPYLASANHWEFQQRNSMLDANQALSWIVFVRDRALFEEEFPNLKIERLELLPWFSYLISGGVNSRSLIPSFLAPMGSAMDLLLRPLDPIFALHWYIRLRKI